MPISIKSLTQVFGLFALLIFNSQASASNWYLKSSLDFNSVSFEKTETVDFDGSPLAIGDVEVANNDNGDKAGYSLSIGYDINHFFSVELSYVDLGEFSLESNLELTVGAVSTDPILGAGGSSSIIVNETSQTVDYEADAFTLKLVGVYPLTQKVSVIGNIGLTKIDANVDILVESKSYNSGSGSFGLGSSPALSADETVNYSSSFSENELVAGFGVRYELSDNLAVDAQWQRFFNTPGSVIYSGYEYVDGSFVPSEDTTNIAFAKDNIDSFSLAVVYSF